MTLQVIMPMGGLGLRFQKEGFVTPKPMILIEGLPMFAKALKSLDPYDAPKEVWIVVREDDQLNAGLQSKIKDFYPDCSIVESVRTENRPRLAMSIRWSLRSRER